MSSEFWLNVAISIISLVIGSFVSIYSLDIRHRFSRWRAGISDKRRAKYVESLKRRLELVDKISESPTKAAAYFGGALAIALGDFVMTVACVFFSFFLAKQSLQPNALAGIASALVLLPAFFFWSQTMEVLLEARQASKDILNIERARPDIVNEIVEFQAEATK